MLVNDQPRAQAGEVVLTLEDAKGRPVAEANQPFSMGELGNQTVEIPLTIPNAAPASCTLKARARANGNRQATVSRRWVKLEEAQRDLP